MVAIEIAVIAVRKIPS